MAKATQNSGELIDIPECWIEIPQLNAKIVMNNLPDISDSKSASYSDETSIGRSTTFKNFSHSDNRTISWTCHFFLCKYRDDEIILKNIRILEACVYPITDNTGGAPYAPPPICHLKCGKLLGEDYICAVLKNYSVKFDTNLPWSEDSYIPYKVDIDLQFDVVYNQSNLPGAERIMKLGA